MPDWEYIEHLRLFFGAVISIVAIGVHFVFKAIYTMFPTILK